MAKKSKKSLHSSKIFLAIIFLLIGIVIGYIIQGKKIEEKDKLLSQKDEEAQLILEDRGRLDGEDTTEYSFADFGLYSPLFEGKQSENEYYWYRGDQIVGRFMPLENDIFVQVWQYEKGADRAIFGGYENYINGATSVQKIIESAQGEYVIADGIKMFWTTNLYPGGKTVYLNYNQNYSPSGKPALFRIGKNINLVTDTPPSEAQIRQEITKVADTLKVHK